MLASIPVRFHCRTASPTQNLARLSSGLVVGARSVEITSLAQSLQ